MKALGLGPAIAFVTVALAMGCGGETRPPSAPTSSAPTAGADAAGGTPGERCLAVAQAARARRADEPAKVSVKHVLVKYAGAKRAAASVTRTREEACLRAEEARAKLEAGVAFAEIVASYSEEPGAASREGAIGAVARGDVVPPFADAAFELQIGQASHVVETDFGFHVLVRTE